jgi:uncharacterized protein YcbK (DUF882 family)
MAKQLAALALLALVSGVLGSSSVAQAQPAKGATGQRETTRLTRGGGAPRTTSHAHPTTKTRAPALPPHYLESMHGWHAAPKVEPLKDERGRAYLVLSSINGGEQVALTATRDDGGFSVADLDRASHALREPGSNNEHPIDPRLLDVVYQLQVHFGVPEIRILSGYRTPGRRGASNHGRGRAMDIVVPGVKDTDLASFARQIGFVGVGIYPTSGFVHVDIRSRSYFWSDASGPGRKNRERGILGDLAKSSDEAAVARGEHATPAFEVGFDVDAALKTGLARASEADTDDDDDDDPGS